MTGEQGTLDSSMGGNYMNKASSYGPAVFKIAELVSCCLINLKKVHLTFFMNSESGEGGGEKSTAGFSLD